MKAMERIIQGILVIDLCNHHFDQSCPLSIHSQNLHLDHLNEVSILLLAIGDYHNQFLVSTVYLIR